MTINKQRAYFAGGCFWGTQHYLNSAKGVLSSEVGYMGGTSTNPTYKEVKTGHTGHLEVLKVDFDATLTNFRELCKLFFEIHDPGQEDGQGHDIGSQYLSAIFYCTNEQKEDSELLINLLRSKGHKVVTALYPAEDYKYYPAEDYHQHYFEKNAGEPDCHFRVKKF